MVETEKAAKIQIKNYMLLVSRQNLDYRRYWIHYFLTLNCSFYKKGFYKIGRNFRETGRDGKPDGSI